MSFSQVDMINMLKDLKIFSIIHNPRKNGLLYLASNMLKSESVHPGENQYYTLHFS